MKASGIRVSHYSGWETREGEAAGSSDAETSVPSRCEDLALRIPAAFVQYDHTHRLNITVPQEAMDNERFTMIRQLNGITALPVCAHPTAAIFTRHG
ncbi:hypothetical protein DMH27_00870 [Raoultella planticola]|nr:hypothetical protein [Raoultella planticola]